MTSVLPPPPPPLSPPAPKPPGRRPATTAITAVVVVAALAVGGLGGWWLGGDDREPPAQIVVPRAPSTTISKASIGSGQAAQGATPAIDATAVAAAVGPSVVTVSGMVGQGGFSGEAVGTGVIISSDGEILTNAHVIANSNDVRVRFSGNTEPTPAEIVGVDPNNDLALLRVDVDGELPAASLADPSTVRIGEPVVAIGFALDLDGDPSVTSGIVSAIDRTFSVTPELVLDGLIQTDAAISSGNSGGPLVNAAGEVIGINTAVAQSDARVAASNVGFAIGMGEVNDVLDDLRVGGRRQQGFLGVDLADRVDGGSGAVVAEVVPGTPAADSGLRVGDVVVAVDDQPINGSEGLVGIVRDHEPGAEIDIVVVRDGERVTIPVTLASRQDLSG